MASHVDENGMFSKQKDELTIVATKLSKGRKHQECDICGKAFNSKKLLTDHFESNHQNYLTAQKKMQVQCDLSLKPFSNEAGLNVRISSIHMEKLKKEEVPCKKCDRVFESKRFLLRHLDKDHETLQRSECDICNKSFATVLQMKKHILNIHNKKRLTIIQKEIQIQGNVNVNIVI